MKSLKAFLLGTVLVVLPYLGYRQIPKKVVLENRIDFGRITATASCTEGPGCWIYYILPETKEKGSVFFYNRRVFVDIKAPSSPYATWKTTNYSDVPYDVEIHIPEGVSLESY